jgi:hypothetical protein
MILVPQFLVSAVQPWADLYADSSAIATSVEFLHLAGLLVAGGFAMAFDRAALRVSSGSVAQRTSFLAELGAVHAPVLAGLSVVTISGFALLFADVEVLLPSTLFWMKMVALLALLLNGIGIRRFGDRLRRDALNVTSWKALRRGARFSMTLWVLLVFLGVLLGATA